MGSKWKISGNNAQFWCGRGIKENCVCCFLSRACNDELFASNNNSNRASDVVHVIKELGKKYFFRNKGRVNVTIKTKKKTMKKQVCLYVTDIGIARNKFMAGIGHSKSMGR